MCVKDTGRDAKINLSFNITIVSLSLLDFESFTEEDEKLSKKNRGRTFS